MENLRFRAWDKQEREFVPYLHDIVLKHGETIEGIEYEMPHEGIVYNDISYFELLQSTGLKDKNGVEIFEGDIVSCFNEGVSTVAFRYGTFGLLCNGYFEGFINVLGGFEIVGNIYENGDLLK